MAGNNRLAFRIILGFALRRAARAVVELSAAIKAAITLKAIGQVEKRLNVLGLVTAYRVTASAPNVSELPAFVVRDFIATRAKRVGLPEGSRANVVESVYFEHLRAIEYRSRISGVAANIAG
jgi:glycyl-tRNA synthetase beta subunit